MDKALIIFAKTPILGKVKTRLQPHVAPERGLEIYKSFVKEIVGRSITLRGVDKFLGCAPTKDDSFFKELMASCKLGSFNQKGENLGERIVNAFRDYFKKGYKKVVIIGTDSPTMPTDFIRKAFSELSKKDFVVGPCCDGGYYLVGARKVFPSVFHGIPWDSSEVLNKTLDKLYKCRISFALLPFWYDVDTIDGLRFLEKHLKFLGNKNDFSLTL
ncbi:MAG: TIGR04282 family arsenosugar biosynthesis glycosyltransferase [Nitrospirae bacterium]|nr:TIGR04282 family arsenosugar biosynthesis glycosyltransferase [Nitrospirota bacterium]